MNRNPFICAMFHALLGMVVLLAVFLPFSAKAGTEFQLIQSLGKQEGNPYGKLVQDAAGNLYGTTYYGGSKGAGTVFKIDTSGNFSVLHEFDGAEGGANPQAGLIQGSDGNFYGTTKYGGNSVATGINGISGAGTVFKLDSSGNFTVLHEFDGGAGGNYPQTGLIQANDGNFYGTTWGGGNNSVGTVFKLDSSGNFSVLYHFDYIDGGAHSPQGGLIQASDGNLYGTTTYGGNFYGTVFKLDLSGNLTVLYEFEGGSNGENSYGAYPLGSLVQASDGSFFGTTASADGFYPIGTVFKIDSSGNYTHLNSFDSSHDGLIQASDGNFYITTYFGAIPSAYGAVYKMDPAGNLSLLYEFTGGSGGAYPYAALLQGRDGSLYGTTIKGGHFGSGTVFQLDLSGNFQVLHEFEGALVRTPDSLIQAGDGSFYGTEGFSGSYGFGSVFQWDPSGNASILHSFDGYTDGAFPWAALVQGSDGSLYGATYGGYLDYNFSDFVYSTLFKIDPDGNFSTLHTFDGTDGHAVYGELIRATDGSFYGTATDGGNGYGTVFKLDPSTNNVSVVHEFEGGSQGRIPYAALLQGTDGYFYGTTAYGGANDAGIVYKLDASGNFSVLHELDGAGDGAHPFAALIQGTDESLYGISTYGGTVTEDAPSGAGTVFKVDPAGQFSVLHPFDGAGGGFYPNSLIQGSDGNFYGAAQWGGDNNNGILFKLDPSGSFSILHTFDGTDGSNPEKLLLANDGSIYGFTGSGGPFGGGVFFRLVANIEPVAHAGTDQTVNAGTKVTLNGAGSSDPDNGPSPLTYQWTQTGGPSITLKGSTTAQPSFTPLEPGIYVFSLVVNDGDAGSAADSMTVTVNDADYVLIQSPNGGEVWNEKSRQTVTWISHNLDTKLRLVLYLSIDNGQTWSKIATPKNSGSKNWKVPKNRYVSKQALFKVCVKPDEALCDVSDAAFTINQAPKAEAGKRQKVTAGTEVILDGNASVDADNGPSPLTYRWTQKSGPAVTLNGADTATPSFIPTVKGSYRFSLMVNDGAIDSKADKVTVQVKKAP